MAQIAIAQCSEFDWKKKDYFENFQKRVPGTKARWWSWSKNKVINHTIGFSAWTWNEVCVPNWVLSKIHEPWNWFRCMHIMHSTKFKQLWNSLKGMKNFHHNHICLLDFTKSGKRFAEVSSKLNFSHCSKYLIDFLLGW